MEQGWISIFIRRLLSLSPVPESCACGILRFDFWAGCWNSVDLGIRKMRRRPRYASPHPGPVLAPDRTPQKNVVPVDAALIDAFAPRTV